MKKYKPTTPSLRHRKIKDTKLLYHGRSLKQFQLGSKKSGGRNHSGHITSYHRGGGHKKKFRKID